MPGMLGWPWRSRQLAAAPATLPPPGAQDMYLRTDGTVRTRDSLGNEFMIGPEPWFGAVDHGFSSTFDHLMMNTGGASTLTAGVMYLGRVKILATTTLTQVTHYVTTAGAAVSNGYVALYSADGTRRAVSAAQTTAWQTASLKQTPFAASYTAPPGLYWIAVLVGAATTMPVWARSSSSGAFTGLTNLNLAAGSLRFANYGTAQTACPTSVTLASLTANDLPLWLAVS